MTAPRNAPTSPLTADLRREVVRLWGPSARVVQEQTYEGPAPLLGRRRKRYRAVVMASAPGVPERVVAKTGWLWVIPRRGPVVERTLAALLDGLTHTKEAPAVADLSSCLAFY